MPILHYERTFNDGRRVVVISSCDPELNGGNARYRRIGIIEVVPGFAGIPPGISLRYRAVKAVIRNYAPVCAGKTITPRCRAYHVIKQAIAIVAQME